MADRGLTRVLCEGGGQLAAALLRADLIDEIVAISAGKVIGGDGVPGIGALGLDRLEDAPRFERRETRALGADTLVRFHRARGAQTA